MTTKEAATRWQVSERTVRSWCSEGLIEGAAQSGDNKTWSVPENALSPYKFGRRQYKHLEQRLVLILEAMSLRKTLHPIQFNYGRQDMREEFLTLLKAGLIEEKEAKPDESEDVEDLFRYYKLSLKGIEFRNEHKTLPQIIKAITPLIAVATEAAVRGAMPERK